MPKPITKKQLQNQVDMLNEALEAALSVSPERDNNFFTGGLSGLYGDPLNRNSWDRKKVFAESLRAWRVNPIARRIVRLMSSFVIGKGITIKSDDPQTNEFLQEWWNHRLNKIGKNAKRWKDEDTRTGNLFFLFSVDQAGMSFVRAVPADQIEEIEHTEHDIEQETRYTKDADGTEAYKAYDPQDTEQTSFMLHFASNRPVGACWGEADLSPLLVWIGRFSSWLEDRVRLNRFRTAFMYVIRGSYQNEAERIAREKYINANPPKSGSTLVLNSNNGESWGILSAQLDSFDASLDGGSIKKMIASGIGYPLHWLAEPEDGNRSTAEAAGTPTFRTLEETQGEFFDVLQELARVACEVRARTDQTIKPDSLIEIDGPDITERDNATLALALGRAYPNLADLFDREAIDDEEFMRLTYKMFAEVWEPDGKKKLKISRKPLTKPGVDQTPGTAVSPDDEAEPTDPKEQNSLIRALFERIPEAQEPRETTINITNQLPEPQPPTVNVTNKVPTPAVTVQNQIPEQPAPIVSVENQIAAPIVRIENQIPEQEPPTVNVTNEVPTPAVTIENQIEQPTVKIMPPSVETEPALPKRKRKK